ncbi:MAG: agmatine deiminase family protein [Bacteroidales bacterium]|nr:agmatine deiminase family protein [Bacteroidales bacterium]
MSLRKLIVLTAFLNLFYFGKSQDINPYEQNPLPKGFTSEELTRKAEIGRDFVATDPPLSPVRNIAEWERNEAVLIRYPLGISLALVAEMASNCKVITIVANQTTENQARSAYLGAGVDLDNCVFIHAPTNSYWTRDYGPWFVADQNHQVGIVDFVYNRPRPYDDEIPVIVAGFLNIPLYGMSLVHTGGNYMTDGVGISASTDLVIEENGNNQPYVLQMMSDYLGINTYHTTLDPPASSIRHIDCWGKFLAPDKILIAQVPESDSRYWAYEEVAEYFSQQSSSYGTPYRVYRVYTPNRQPYTNSLILNEKVLVPVMGTSWDAQALAAYEAAMPGYEVIGFTGSWLSSDALHCRTKEIADRGMLCISHMPILNQQPVLPGYEVSANIIPYSGAGLYTDSLLLIYRVNAGAWDTIQLLNGSGHTYSASIPFLLNGGHVSYYIFAADSSGRREMHSFMGYHDPHVFEAGDNPEAPFDPQPLHLSVDVPLAGELQWQFGINTDAYHLLFGMQGQMDTVVNNANAVLAGAFSYQGLDSKTAYTWQVIALNTVAGLATEGPVWSFSTACAVFIPDFSETFDNASFPDCWEQVFLGGITSNRWNVNNTANAGGAAYEMRAAYTNSTGTSRLILPAINMAWHEDVTLSFRQFYDDYGSGCVLKIQSSLDRVNWTDESWSYNSGNGNIPSTQTSVPIVHNLGPTTYLAFVIEGNHYQIDYWYIDNVMVSGTSVIPVTLLVQDINVPSGAADCFAASQTIFVAGGGTTFTVNQGGNAILAAGQNIIFLDGTWLEYGSYMNAHIENNGDYCSNTEYLLASGEVNTDILDLLKSGSDPDSIEHAKSSFFQVFPNPTEGIVNILLLEVSEPEPVSVEIFNSIGNKIFDSAFPVNSHLVLDLSPYPRGLYMIKVTRKDYSGVNRIIRN